MEGIESPGDILLSRGGHYFWLGITAQHTREGFFSVSAYCGVGSRQLTGQALQRTSYRELLGVDFRSDCSIDNLPILAQHLAFWNIRALLGAPDCPIDLVWDFSACVEYYIDWTGVGSRLLATLAQALLLFGAGVGSLNFILLALQIIFRLLGVGSQHHSLAQRLQTTGVGSLFYQLLAWFLVLVAGVGSLFSHWPFYTTFQFCLAPRHWCNFVYNCHIFSFEQRQLYFHSIVSCSCWPWPLSVVVIQHSAFDFICFHWHLDTLDTSDHRNLLSGILHVGIALQNSCEGTSETDKLDANLVPIPGAQSSQSCWAVF